ncbi:hypothetical protein OAA19_02000 [Rubripirellula sp.]|nr:hypothetical protein [Rubripirellula sp.]MDB4338861.1 hypothetical protein [Rubripirellula sp.]
MHAIYSAVVASIFAQNSSMMMRECKTVSFSAVADYWCVQITHRFVGTGDGAIE